MPCPFCETKIIQKQKYFQSKCFWILINSRPITYAHSLIVPKRHVEYFNQLNKEETVDLLKVINALVKKLLPKLGCNGYNLLINNGVSAGQTVNHVHLHFIPRKEGDRKEDFKNLCFPTEKNRVNLTDTQFEERIQKLANLLNRD